MVGVTGNLRVRRCLRRNSRRHHPRICLRPHYVLQPVHKSGNHVAGVIPIVRRGQVVPRRGRGVPLLELDRFQVPVVPVAVARPVIQTLGLAHVGGATLERHILQARGVSRGVVIVVISAGCRGSLHEGTDPITRIVRSHGLVAVGIDETLELALLSDRNAHVPVEKLEL